MFLLSPSNHTTLAFILGVVVVACRLVVFWFLCRGCFSFGWWLLVVGAFIALSGWGGSAVACPRSRGCSHGGYCVLHYHPTLFGNLDARRVVALGVVVGLWWSLWGGCWRCGIGSFP